jgi:suppressor of fused
MSEQDTNSPGWDAIDAALKNIYGHQAPKHFGTMISYQLGGPDPLQGISAYKVLEPAPHWHFVTYGFSELYEKESSDLEYSGYGIELTFRLRDDSKNDDPPDWALNFLQNLARYVFQSGNVFASGHYMNLNGPIALESATNIRSIAFISDPKLSAIDTPNGKVDFLQVVGITNDEELALKQWSTLKALEVFAAKLPLYITDLSRTTLMIDESIKSEIAMGSLRDGSNTGFTYIGKISAQRKKPLFGSEKLAVYLGAQHINELLAIMPLRLKYEREYRLIGDNFIVRFKPGKQYIAIDEKAELHVTLTAEMVDELVQCLKPIAGSYKLNSAKGLVFEVSVSEIRDSEGNTIETIG